jgi:hypothetical protein
MFADKLKTPVVLANQQAQSVLAAADPVYEHDPRQTEPPGTPSWSSLDAVCRVSQSPRNLGPCPLVSRGCQIS